MSSKTTQPVTLTSHLKTKGFRLFSFSKMYVMNVNIWSTAIYFLCPFTKRHKLIHNGRFLKFEVVYCSQHTVKSIKIQ